MANLFGWLNNAGNLHNEAPKSPWGSSGGSGDNGGSGSGSGGDGKGGSGEGKGGSGPRNPWSFPPEGRRPRSGGGGGGGGGNGPLDDLFRRVGGGGGGLPIPSGGGRLWSLVVAGLLLVWVVFTSFHTIGARERGVVTTLGRYSATLGSGIKFTLPFPIQSVEIVDVGSVHTEKFPDNSPNNLMLTGDQNIVDLAYSVNWYINDPADYSFQIKDPKETVKDTAESAMRAVIATTTLTEAIGEGQGRISADVQAAMQKILDEYHSGIRIQSVALTKAAAPAEVDDAFKAVQAAQQGAQAARASANGYAQQVVAVAQGEAAEFDKIYEQYKAAPEVTRRRIYYETMEQVLARTNKTIVETPGVTPYLPLPGVRPETGKTQQGGAK